MRKWIVVLIILLTFGFGLGVGWQIGHIEAATGIAKLELIQSVEDLDKLRERKTEALDGSIRLRMSGAVVGVRRLPSNPFWRIRYAFGNPFDDQLIQHFLPIAEADSQPVGEEFFPQYYPPKTSGSDAKP